ncbi:hypothetical protein CKAH01_11150 [Colletotrichum kahawae]|uniref:Uncharacterized protein n=1 Tax=Colletotrichum kahawae TaxID=34407 RepID=A0AAD9XVH0_COLKA|nr:hypothetical protein CKAH01_11150 [Colletotrichum kahawae]
MFCRSRGFLWRRWARYGYCARCLLLRAGWGREGFWFSSLAFSPVTGRGLSFCEMLLFSWRDGSWLTLCGSRDGASSTSSCSIPTSGTRISRSFRLYTSATVPTLFRGDGLLFTELVYCLMIG